MRATAIAHPNVALVKYWGKQNSSLNLPATGSLSITLGGLHTRTTVEFDGDLQADRLILEGSEDSAASERMVRCLDKLRSLSGVSQYARVESENDFPTGAGLASSASGFAALTVAAAGALGIQPELQELVRIARLGSGSAPRSLLAGGVYLDIDTEPGETICSTVLKPQDWPLEVVVAVTSTERKKVSSTSGMEASRSASPYFNGWVASHPADLDTALKCLRERDFERLADISEHSCLKMHALALSTQPPLIYWEPATVACMHVLRDLRAQGVPVFFTIDAGPQVKAVCLPEATRKVQEALAAVPGVLQTLLCTLGEGAWLDESE